jgi:hypothetical protein
MMGALPFIASRPSRAQLKDGLGYIYFVASGDFVKIGFTTLLPARLEVLSAGTPGGVELLRYEIGRIELEAEHHRRFEAYRVNGEWFKLEGELLAYLAQPKERTEFQNGGVRDVSE